MSSEVAKRLRLLASVLSVLILAALLGAGWFYSRLRASLPQLDGTARLPGLAGPVTIERDALGVPRIRGGSREDVARALGFAHAQDRFFQMDLLRRRPAAELAELVGPAALPADRAVSRHGFRALARAALERMDAGQRRVLEAYAQGVNTGLAALRAPPFEYLVLRTAPRPWMPEDSLLINCAMVLTLQDDAGRYERTLDTLRETYGDAGLAFFAPILTPEDAAVDGTTGRLAPIPGPGVINLRETPVAAAELGSRPPRDLFSEPDAVAGSNSFALAGARTATGAGLIENDMHLDLTVPNIWYRADLEWGGRRVVGVTIPGEPLVVAGSNGRVAWGFTNAKTDAGDLVRVPPTESPNLYQGPGESGLRPFERRVARIRVKGGTAVEAESRWTLWGPVVGRDSHGQWLAYRWAEYDPGAIDFGLIGMETADNVDEAMRVAHHSGIPPQNFVVVDTAGHLGWTIAGPVPRRVGFDGRLPTTWTFGDRRWDGFLPPGQVPVVKDPPGGSLWTANNRVVGGPALALLGDGGYARPARAAQIRDDLAALPAGPAATPRDLLAIALDDRALFLSRWRRLLIDTLTPSAAAPGGARARLRALVESGGDRASADSAAYTVVRDFHAALVDRVLAPIFAPCMAADAGFDRGRLQCDDAVWAIVHARPAHLLDPRYAGWDDLILAAVDDAGAAAKDTGGRIESAAWGRRNALRMAHPFSRLLPAWLTGWLNMPADPLPGDNDMPRLQTPGPSHGASERFAVSPGHEEQGIFEMPGGQSGHPLSPYYRAGHNAWLKGEPAPFLPGPPQHTLTLLP